MPPAIFRLVLQALRAFTRRLAQELLSDPCTKAWAQGGLTLDFDEGGWGHGRRIIDGEGQYVLFLSTSLNSSVRLSSKAGFTLEKLIRNERQLQETALSTEAQTLQFGFENRQCLMCDISFSSVQFRTKHEFSEERARRPTHCQKFIIIGGCGLLLPRGGAEEVMERQ